MELPCVSFTSSPHGDATGQPGGLGGVVRRGLFPRRRLRSGRPVVPAVHAVLLRVLVPPRLRGLQVSCRLWRSCATSPSLTFSFSFVCAQERQLVPFLSLLLRVRVPAGRVRDAERGHPGMGSLVGNTALRGAARQKVMTKINQ